MNCILFQSSVSDLARGDLLDDSRRAALDHAKECDVCAAQLNNEQKLSAGLQVLASATQDQEAPPHVERKLLDAFRARSKWRQAQSRARLVWAGRAIATTAAAAAVSLFVFSGAERPRPDNVGPGTSSEPGAPAVEQTKQPGNEVSGQAVWSDLDLRDKSARREVKRSRSQHSKTRIANNPAPQREVATEFIPVMYGQGLPPIEGGRLIRVQLPRSALWSFGLPMNVDRAGSRITADVLVGNDGMARAVRFVQ